MAYFSKPKWAQKKFVPRPRRYDKRVDIVRARRANLLRKYALMTKAVNALKKRFVKKSFARRGASFMKSKYFGYLHRKWGMKP